MNKINLTLKPLVRGCNPADTGYIVCAMHVVLEAGRFPRNFYRLIAEREGTTPDAVRKGLSRIAPEIWKNSVGILHEQEDKYPGPLYVLHELAFLISDGNVL